MEHERSGAGHKPNRPCRRVIMRCERELDGRERLDVYRIRKALDD